MPKQALDRSVPLRMVSGLGPTAVCLVVSTFIHISQIAGGNCGLLLRRRNGILEAFLTAFGISISYYRLGDRSEQVHLC